MTGTRLTANELFRQAVHMGAGVLAFGLRWLGAWPLAAVALAGALFNAWLLPRLGGHRLWRQREMEVERASGIVLYPISVLVLLLLFLRRPEVAAAGWGLLAFGDGAASLVGQLCRGRPLPWNPNKSWPGFVGYWLAGWLAVGALVSWTVPGRHGTLFLWSVAAATALLGAVLESAPQQLDDNLGVPQVAALLLLGLLWTEGNWSLLAEPAFLRNLLIGLFANALLATAGFALSTLDAVGATIAGALGTVIFAFADWPAYLVLLVFFVLASATTRLGYSQKARRRLAEARGGRRRAANALANGGVAAACAVFAGLTPYESVFLLALVGALAAAAADTVESEIGQLWGRPTVLVTTLRRVEPGTDGGVSPTGTLAGLIAAGLTVGVGWAVGLYSASAILPLTALSLTATVAESIAGATLERAGLLDNNAVNFLNTLLGALLGASLGLMML